MGVPKFFCYVSERYPCLSELVREFQIPDFDNLYLDMNGIIHACSHPNDYDPNFSITEESIFASIFHYIEVLYNMIKPRKIFFLAVDGVAPRAKMNQQRARRFRSAKDAEELEKKVMAEQNVPPKTPRFDSNCITPGTVFMDSLHAQLKYFISSKISTDPLWQNCKIILSGHQTPGEGEHKIMDYIRYLKTLPEYDPNTRHCLYGLDADLIMLGLCTHEPHFSLLREKVQFGKSKNKRIISPDETQFYLLHLSLMREYIDLEFQELKEKLSFEYNLENIIDDWVLMGFLVGNDFIPHLPGLHINKGALPILYKTYKAVLPSLDGYLNENGYLNLPRFQVYMEKLGEHDMKVFEETYANLAFLEEKTGKSNSVEEKTEKSNSVEEKTEKSNSVEEKTEKSNSVEEKTEKSNSVEEKTEKSNSVEEKTEKSNSVEEKTEKSNSVEEKTEKSNSVEEKTEKSNSVEEKTEKSNSVEEKTEKSNSVEEKTEKSNSVEEKTEKSNSVEEQQQPQPAAFKNSDLEKLIKATNELFVNCDGEEEELLEDDNETFIVEFHQHKKDYYTSKLDYSNVTEEVLKSQAEGYIRAIQWNLHYYYQGCQSWSWFYPHHYAPYISDIKNFKDLKLDFELGKPFLPFEQLLAVLPAASKKLLPKVYQDLMTSPNSPIKDFYPTDFATDLNGKSQEWEAVVLIPLIDEKRLLKAMEPFNDKLTKKERKRNTHGPMHVFTYTEKDLGLYKSPQYFPSIIANHAVVVDVDMKEISVDTAMLRYGLRPGVHLDVFYPGFPTFKHIPHTSYLKACHLKIFDWFSRGDSMVLTIGERKFPPVKELAKDYLGKVVYVNWPHLVESKVVAIADEECKYTMTEKGEIEESILNKDEKNVFLATCTELKDRYFKNLGIEIGEPEVIVYVNGLNGRKYIFGPYGKVTQERIWSVDATPQPLQTVVKDLKVAETAAHAYYDYLDVIPIGSKVFMMGQPHFGSMGTVLDSTHCMKNERLKISFEIKSSPVLDEDLFTSKMVYMPGRIAAIRVGISTKLFAQITGCIFVGTSDGKKMENFDTIKVNIGLNMKHSFRNEELPGYTKKENDTWLYSAKAVELAVTYVRLFPHIVEKLSEYPNKSDFLVHEMFPNTDGVSALLNIINWIKSQDHYNVKPVKVGSEILETEVVDRLTDLIDKFTPETVTRVMHVKPRLLYKSDLVCGNLPPVENAKHFLFDRVVSIRSSYTVPLGLRGFIIAKHIGSTPSDYLYDVLFDRPFVGGSAQNTAPGRVFRMTSNSFLNISDKNRGAQGKTVISSKTLSVSLEPQVKMKPPMYQGSDEVKEKPTSAFALWNQQQNIVNPPGERVEDDHFREIWQNLQNAKPDDERTGLLKQILKIDEKKAPVIEEPVKLFFQKVSSSTKALPPFENCQNGVQEGPILSIVNSDNQSPNRYCVQLFSYYQRRNMGQPRYHYIYSGNKIIAQIMMWDGKVFSGLPCDEKVCASESAALQALAALGEFPINHCDAILRRGGGGIATAAAAAAVGAGGGNENNVLINDNVSMKENNHLFGRDGGNFVRAPVQPIMSNVLPFNIPPPPSQWVEYRSQNYYPRPMPPPPPQPFFRNIDGIGNMNQIQGNPPDRPQDFVRPLTTGSKVSAASLGFVPLQAITGKRNVGVIPTRNYYKTVKKPSNPSEDYKPDVATVSQPSGTPTPSVKPRRRPKIAANLALDENLY